MTTLSERTYSLLRQVPAGRVTTYKAIACALGTKAYRAIGQILRRNPYAPTVPCHRVVGSDGTIGGFMGKTSGRAIKKKLVMLEKEGVRVRGKKVVDFTNLLYQFR